MFSYFLTSLGLHIRNWLTIIFFFSHFLNPSACHYCNHARRTVQLTTIKWMRCVNNFPRSGLGWTGGQWQTSKPFFFPAAAICLRTCQMATTDFQAQQMPKRTCIEYTTYSGKHTTAFLLNNSQLISFNLALFPQCGQEVLAFRLLQALCLCKGIGDVPISGNAQGCHLIWGHAKKISQMLPNLLVGSSQPRGRGLS